MKKTIYKVVCIGLIISNVILNTAILKEIKNLKTTETVNVPDIDKLVYFDEHKLTINKMSQIKALETKPYMVFFYSDECKMCDLTKEDLAAFIYYRWTEDINIYFVDINRSPEIIGESEDDKLENQLIYATPTMFVVSGDNYKKYEGVDEIYNLLNTYVKK